MSIAFLIPGQLYALLAVVTATVAGGRIAGTLVLAGSAVALLYSFVPDPDSFTGGTASDYFSVLLYLLVGAVLIAAVSSLIDGSEQAPDGTSATCSC